GHCDRLYLLLAGFVLLWYYRVVDSLPPACASRRTSRSNSGFALSLPMLRLALVATLLLPALAPAADPALDTKKVEFFETKIRPVLVEQCYKCHTPETKSGIGGMKKGGRGGLNLDTKAGLLKGGGHGPAVVPGKPADSLPL